MFSAYCRVSKKKIVQYPIGGFVIFLIIEKLSTVEIYEMCIRDSLPHNRYKMLAVCIKAEEGRIKFVIRKKTDVYKRQDNVTPAKTGRSFVYTRYRTGSRTDP